MAMKLRYRGSFLDRHNQEWRVDILQESDTAFTVGELTFEAEEPLVIEWPVSDKEQVIQGSRTSAPVSTQCRSPSPTSASSTD